MSLWIDHFPPVGETASRLAYIQKPEAHILHGRLHLPTSEFVISNRFKEASRFLLFIINLLASLNLLEKTEFPEK